MIRRTLLLAFAAAAFAGAVHAEGPKTLPAEKAFPFLDKYYGLPAPERSRFGLRYRFGQKGGKPVGPDFTLTLIEGGAETPIPIDDGGFVTRPPTAAQLAHKAQVRASASGDYAVSMIPEALVRPAAEMPTGELVAAVDQLSAGVKKLAGVISLIAPKFTRISFAGAEGGVLVGADGRTTPLGMHGAHHTPTLDVADARTARALRFAKPPSHVYLIPPAK